MTDVLPYHTQNRDIAIRSAIHSMELPIDLTTINVSEGVCSTLRQCWQQQPTLRPTMVDCLTTFDPRNELEQAPKPSLPPFTNPRSTRKLTKPEGDEDYEWAETDKKAAEIQERPLANGTPASELMAPVIALAPKLSPEAKRSSTADALSSRQPSIPSRSPQRWTHRPSAFDKIMKEAFLAPNSRQPRSTFPASAVAGGPNLHGAYNRAPDRPLPRRPSDVPQVADTITNTKPSLTLLVPSLTPETARSSSSITPPNGSTPPGPRTSKRNNALLEMLCSERVYAADLVLATEIHIPLSRGSSPGYEVALGGFGRSPSRSSPPHRHTSASMRTNFWASRAPSSATPADPPMSLEASKRIFLNIDELAEFADIFAVRIERALGHTVPSGEGGDRVGELFLQVLPSFARIYIFYIIFYRSALCQFQALPQTPALTQYIAQTEALSQPHPIAWDIPSLLIRPIQRVTKYASLLGAIYNETPETHSDKANLLEAKERLEELAAASTAVNESPSILATVKGTLNRGKSNSSGNGAPPVAPSTILKGRSLEELDRERADTEVWERRLKKCDVVVRELAGHALGWNQRLDDSLKTLKVWNASFGRVVGLGDQGVDAVGAFENVVSDIQGISGDFNLWVQVDFLPRMSSLLHTITSPRKLVSRVATLRLSHIVLMNISYDESRPPKALMKDRINYVTLQATLREELPKYFVLFEKGLGALVLELARWQRNLFQEINKRWVTFWMGIAKDGGVDGSGASSSDFAETMRMWWERFEEVQQALTNFNIVPVAKVLSPPSHHQGSVTSD